MVKNSALDTETPKASKSQKTGKGIKLRIGMIGFGTVGRSVAKIICQDPDAPFVLTYICNRNIARKKAEGLSAGIRWTENVDEVLASDVDVVIELVGGIEPAAEWITKALRAGKSVVTANKLLVSERGAELAQLARKMGRRLEYGASVAGGIPAIIGIQEGLAGDRLYRIAGILNGTCNYILTQMEAHGASFDSALKDAQKLGYAESDPTSDVEGYDARAKLVILTQAGLHLDVKNNDIACRPISLIEAIDFAYARDLNCTIRQISCVEKDNAKELRLFAAVQPAMVPLSSLMAHAAGSKNLVVASGEFSGQMVFSGYGAGGDPTAVAVVSDLYSIARSANAPLAYIQTTVEKPASVTGDFTVPHYIRFLVKDQPGIVASIAAVLAKESISLDAVLQKPGYPHEHLPFVMTIEKCSSHALNHALKEIDQFDFHVQPPLCLPIFE